MDIAIAIDACTYVRICAYVCAYEYTVIMTYTYEHVRSTRQASPPVPRYWCTRTCRRPCDRTCTAAPAPPRAAPGYSNVDTPAVFNVSGLNVVTIARPASFSRRLPRAGAACVPISRRWEALTAVEGVPGGSVWLRMRFLPTNFAFSVFMRTSS